MGHTLCGGIKAAIDGKSHGGMLDLWVSALKDTYEKHYEELEKIEDINEKANKLSEYNVV